MLYILYFVYMTAESYIILLIVNGIILYCNSTAEANGPV